MNGQAIAFFGIVLSVVLCGAGSAIGLFKTGSASAGVMAEDGKKFGKIIVLTLLPATQGLYGFVVAIIASGNAVADMSVEAGWSLFAAVVAIAGMGLVSAVYQGKAAASCICAVGKNETVSGKLMLFPAMIEFYAILSFVMSIILINAL